MKTGVVIGKFYPPHAGHHHLIDFGLNHCDRLTVIVCDHPGQQISGETRADWLRERHPSAIVVVTPDDLPDEPKPWARRTLQVLEHKPDFVFTSEDYGERYAQAMESCHILVDRDRVSVPVSATKIRHDPYAHWDYLSPAVREFFALRVVLIGVESSGKTTLAADLAESFNTHWVEEYGRDYAADKVASVTPEWESGDFFVIATEQQKRENLGARSANRVLICDTNATATGVWHERYMGFRSESVDRIGLNDRVDLYLLTMPDFPFVQDGTRDGEHIRDWMHRRFVERLQESKVPSITLGGGHFERLGIASEAIQNLFGTVRRLS